MRKFLLFLLPSIILFACNNENAGETKRITIYGFGGDDVFDIENDIHRIKIIIQKEINKAQFPGKDGAAE